MTETLRGPPDHSLFPHRKREGGSLLALNTRKKTAALGSGSKLPLPRNRWRLYDSRGLHIGVDDEIRTHAGKANGNITFRSGAGIWKYGNLPVTKHTRMQENPDDTVSTSGKLRICTSALNNLFGHLSNWPTIRLWVPRCTKHRSFKRSVEKRYCQSV